MARMTIIIEVDQDPTRNDPHDVAEDVIYQFNEAQRVNGDDTVEFIGAEWVN